MSANPSQGTGSHCPRSRFFSVARLLPLLMLLVFSVVAHAQTISGTTADGFSYTGSYATATITGYSGTSNSVIIPNTIGNYQVRYIQAYAFSNCSSVTSVTIPANVLSADEAFAFCPKLTSITVDAYNHLLSSVDGVLFDKAKTTLLQFPTAKIGNPYTIPDSVRTIGMAFLGCTGLTSITIPNSVTYIGMYAFYGSARLTSIAIPDSVRNIGNGAFSGCTGLVGVKLSSSLTSIGDYTFYNCFQLTSITIPDSVTTTGTAAFFGCSKLTSITIPNTITTAGTSTFPSCTKVANVTVSPGVATSGSSIGAGLFSGWTSLTSVTFLPGVSKIGDGVFSGCSNLASVSIPDSVTTIGSNAFSSCTSLTNVTLGNGVTSIGDYAFDYCTSLTNITLGNGVTSIGDYAFYSCSKLTVVTIPDSVRTIGHHAFYRCWLTSVTLGNGVTTIGDHAFYINKLTSVIIPSSAISIGNAAFGYNSELTSITVDAQNSAFSSNADGILFNKEQTMLIQYPGGRAGNYTIPNSVTNIANAAFVYCLGLPSVTIPSSITNIGNSAFYGCATLKNAVFPGNAPTMGSNVFTSTASGFAVYYFDGATGFTSPTWSGYPAVNMGALSPVPPWLLSKKLAYNADLKSAPNGDGVPLLMAYALNLDPTRNQSNRLPRPVVAGDQMSLTFYAGSADVTYTVESSADLQTWDITDVTTSTPDANNLCTATLPLTGPRRFMRLVVGH